MINGPIQYIQKTGFTIIKIPFLSPYNIQAILEIFSNKPGDEPKFDDYMFSQQLIIARTVKRVGTFSYERMKLINEDKNEYKKTLAEGYIFEMTSWTAGKTRFVWLSLDNNDFWEDPFLNESEYKDSDEEERVWPNFKQPKFFCQGHLKYSKGCKFGTHYNGSDERFIHSDISLDPCKFENFYKVWVRINRDIKKRIEFKASQKTRRKAGLPIDKNEPFHTHLFDKQVNNFIHVSLSLLISDS